MLLKSQNNINLYQKFNSQLNLTKIFAKYSYLQGSPVEPELGTAQPQLLLISIMGRSLPSLFSILGHNHRRRKNKRYQINL